MSFYNTNLSFWENFHNSVISLSVIGFVLLLFVLICHLTAKTKEQKDDVKTMFYYGVPVGVIAIVLSLCLYPTAKMNLDIPANTTVIEKNEYNSKTQYTSAIAKDDCRLCGENPNDLLHFYRGENNIGILDLNTFNFARLEINRYDDNHNLIEEKAGYMRVCDTATIGGGIASFNVNSDRGYADGTITFKENSRLSFDNLSLHICSDCLTDIMNQYMYKEEHYSIALINFENNKVRPIETAVTGFSFDDFQVKIIFGEADNKMDLFIWYAPIRY